MTHFFVKICHVTEKYFKDNQSFVTRLHFTNAYAALLKNCYQYIGTLIPSSNVV